MKVSAIDREGWRLMRAATAFLGIIMGILLWMPGSAAAAPAEVQGITCKKPRAAEVTICTLVCSAIKVNRPMSVKSSEFVASSKMTTKVKSGDACATKYEGEGRYEAVCTVKFDHRDWTKITMEAITSYGVCGGEVRFSRNVS